MVPTFWWEAIYGIHGVQQTAYHEEKTNRKKCPETIITQLEAFYPTEEDELNGGLFEVANDPFEYDR